jgi:DHA2 family multidrug resistance protein
VAVIALVLFVFRALDPNNPNPLLRLRMLRDRNVLASVIIGTFTGTILAAAIYALPEYLRTVDPQPRSASQTGQVLCVYAIAAACLRPLATPAQGRFGQRKMTAFALVSLIASMLLMAQFLTTDTPAIYYALPLLLYACCLAPLLAAVGSGTAARVPGGGQIDAVAIYMTFRQFGTALGVALVNIVISRRETLHSSRLFEHLRQGRPDLHAWLSAVSTRMAEHGGRTAVDASSAALAALREISARQASVLAYADVFRVMAVIGVAALMFVPLMSPPPKKT